MSTPSSARGFSLLEAIVALALIGLAGTALFSWLDSTLIAASRVRDVNSEALLMLNALPIVEQVNPMQTPEGNLKAASLTVSWKSRPLGDLRDSTPPGENEGLFRMGLYELDVVATGPHDGAAHFTLRRVGWKHR